MAETRTYVCLRYPHFAIGDKVKFSYGTFTTDDPELQALVEKNDWYGAKNSGMYIWRDDKLVEAPKSEGIPDQNEPRPVWDFRSVPDEARSLPEDSPQAQLAREEAMFHEEDIAPPGPLAAEDFGPRPDLDDDADVQPEAGVHESVNTPETVNTPEVVVYTKTQLTRMSLAELMAAATGLHIPVTGKETRMELKGLILEAQGNG